MALHAGTLSPISHLLILGPDLYAVGYMLSELIALEPETQVAGVTIIADATGFGWKQFRNFGVEDARNMANFVQVRDE